MRRRRIALVAVAPAMVAVAAAVLASGLVAVEPGEVVVVRRLGRVSGGPIGPGLHWVAPLGIDRADQVRTDEVRRLVLGRAGVPGAGEAPGAGEYLSGDLNLLRAEAVVQYRAADPLAFALAGDRVEPALEGVGEASLARALARREIDEALLGGRVAVAAEVASELTEASQRLGLGVAILGVSLADARPPDEVRADFAAAQAARTAAESRLREAEGHAGRARRAAASEAGVAIDRAHADAGRSTALAHARADRFRSLRAELDRSRSLTARRLYRDALRDLLPRVGRTIVLEPDEPLDLSIIGPRTAPEEGGGVAPKVPAGRD